MNAPGHARWHRRAFLVGLAVALLLVPAALAATSFPRGQKSLGLDASFTTLPSGELAMEPGVFARGADMRPGDEIRGERSIRNQTGRVLTVRVRALPSTTDADRLLHARLVVDGLPLFDGTLGQLRRWTDRWFQLKRREERRLSLFVDIPPDASQASQGVVVDIPVELKAEPRYR